MRCLPALEESVEELPLDDSDDDMAELPHDCRRPSAVREMLGTDHARESASDVLGSDAASVNEAARPLLLVAGRPAAEHEAGWKRPVEDDRLVDAVQPAPVGEGDRRQLPVLVTGRSTAEADGETGNDRTVGEKELCWPAGEEGLDDDDRPELGDKRPTGGERRRGDERLRGEERPRGDVWPGDGMPGDGSFQGAWGGGGWRVDGEGLLGMGFSPT